MFKASQHADGSWGLELIAIPISSTISTIDWVAARNPDGSWRLERR